MPPDPISTPPAGNGSPSPPAPAPSTPPPGSLSSESDSSPFPPPTPGPETPSAVPDVTPPAPTPQNILSQLQNRGINTDGFESDEQALDYLLGAAQAWETQHPYLEVGQQAAADWQKYQQWRQSQQQESPSETSAPSNSSEWQWQAPELNPAWLAQIDPVTGQPRPGANPAVIQQIRDWVTWKEQQELNFWKNPRDLVRKAIADDLKQLGPESEAFKKAVQQQVQAQLQEWRAQQESEKLLKENEARFYQLDSNKRPRIDPRTGQMLLTAQGQAFRNYLVELEQQGVPHATAWTTAMRLLDADVATGRFGTPQQPTGNNSLGPTPEGKAPNPRDTFLQHALRQQQTHPGTVPTAPADASISRSVSEPVAGRPPTLNELVESVLKLDV